MLDAARGDEKRTPFARGLLEAALEKLDMEAAREKLDMEAALEASRSKPKPKSKAKSKARKEPSHGPVASPVNPLAPEPARRAKRRGASNAVRG
jgi:hypothetical protein